MRMERILCTGTVCIALCQCNVIHSKMMYSSTNTYKKLIFLLYFLDIKKVSNEKPTPKPQDSKSTKASLVWN